MIIAEIMDKFHLYSITANTNRNDFLESAVQIEVINRDPKNTPDYRLVYTNAIDLLDAIKVMFPLPDDSNSETAYKIILEIIVSLYIYNDFIEEGDIKTFRNNILDVDSSLDHEVKVNSKHKGAVEHIYSYLDSIVKDIDMDVVDNLYNRLSDSIAVLKRFKIANNDYLISFLGWSKDEKIISFIIS